MTRSYTFEQVRFHDYDPGVRVWINDQLVLDTWRPESGPAAVERFRSHAVSLTAGQAVGIRVELAGGKGFGSISQDASGVAILWETSANSAS